MDNELHALRVCVRMKSLKTLCPSSACIYHSRTITDTGIRILVNRLFATSQKGEMRGKGGWWGPARHSYLPQLIDKGVRTGWSWKKLHADDSCLRTHSKQPFKGLGNPLLTVWRFRSTTNSNYRDEPVCPYSVIGPHAARSGFLWQIFLMMPSKGPSCLGRIKSYTKQGKRSWLIHSAFPKATWQKSTSRSSQQVIITTFRPSRINVKSFDGKSYRFCRAESPRIATRVKQ